MKRNSILVLVLGVMLLAAVPAAVACIFCTQGGAFLVDGELVGGG